MRAGFGVVLGVTVLCFLLFVLLLSTCDRPASSRRAAPGTPAAAPADAAELHRLRTGAIASLYDADVNEVFIRDLVHSGYTLTVYTRSGWHDQSESRRNEMERLVETLWSEANGNDTRATVLWIHPPLR